MNLIGVIMVEGCVKMLRGLLISSEVLENSETPLTEILNWRHLLTQTLNCVHPLLLCTPSIAAYTCYWNPMIYYDLP